MSKIITTIVVHCRTCDREMEPVRDSSIYYENGRFQCLDCKLEIQIEFRTVIKPS